MGENHERALAALIEYVAALEERYTTAIRMLADEVEAVSGTASAARQAASMLVDEVERANAEAATVQNALGSVGELFKQKADAASLQSMGTMTMQTLRETQAELAALSKELKRIEEKDPAVEMRVHENMIQYRGKDGWVDLISKKELKGERGLRGLPGESKPGGAGGADSPTTPSGGAVESVNGKTGRVVLGINDIPQLRIELDNRVEKEDGKTLISEAELERLANVDNYNDAELRAELLAATEALKGKVDAVDGMGLISLAEAERLKNVTNYDDTDVRETLEEQAQAVQQLQTTAHTHGNKAVLDSVAQTHIDLLEAIDDASAVDSQGITMRKPFNADGNAVTGIPTPTEPTDAVPYGLLETLRASIIDSIYPVNSIYISYSHTNPATLFGGTWERINNAFLWACDANGEIGKTGGEKTHTLTLDEMPKHTHGMMYQNTGTTSSRVGRFTNGSYGYGSDALEATTGTSYITYRGGDAAHNNMPPYVQVSIWRRTA